MPGLNSLSGSIPDLGNVTGSLSGSNGSNPVSGVTGALSGAGQNGGPATGPLP
jgi:hypothetical protein